MSNIAQGFLTASKAGYPEGTPKAKFGAGAYTHVGDGVGDKQWVDYVCGLGAALLSQGNCPSLPTQQEERLAFKLSELFPVCEKVKILKTGTGACNAAVRIARAYQQNNDNDDWPAGCGTGYHGWGNTFISDEEPGTGTVSDDYIRAKNFDELIGYLKTGGWGYCIIEPVELDLNVQDELKEIRRLCSEKGIILIFDEIITGFRFPEYSVSNYFGIQPDLICLGKGLGNGHPISILGGSADIMETDGYFISGTFFGELSGIESALSTLDYLNTHKINDLWQRGQETITAFNEISDKIQLYGYPTRCIWKGETVFITTFCQQMQKRGYLLHPRVWFITHAHTSTINAQFVDDSKQCINEIIDKNIQLKGVVAQPLFKR